MGCKYYLGIGGFAHDCAVALFRNGELIAAAPEERFTRLKHQGGIPWQAIRFCLNWAGIDADDVSVICHGFKRHKMVRYASSKVWGSIRYPQILLRGASTANKAAQFYWLSRAIMQSEMGLRQLQRIFPRSRHKFVYHHDAHAAAVFLTSPYKDATVLVLDSNGDGASTTLYKAKERKLERILSIPFPHSLGNFYLMFTEYLGFKGGDEYKVMGMAAYGEPRFQRQIRQMFEWKSDIEYRLRLKYCTHQGISGNAQFSPLLIESLGTPIKYEGELNGRAADIAASVQLVLEEVVERLLSNAGSTNKIVCLGGGVAQNSVVNGRLALSGDYDVVHVPPWVTDAGTAIGAAAYVVSEEGFEPILPEHDYWGPEYDDEAIGNAMKRIKVERKKIKSKDALLREVVTRLCAGQIVGWFQGRSEFGERALGNRSILADPRRAEMKDWVNERIKFREEFRPFAPSILAEYYDDYSLCAHPSPFMTHVFEIKPSKRDVIPAVTHVDGTGRFHTVSRRSNELFYELIEAFRRETEVPVVLNTSFNIKGEPIVCSPDDALRTFYNCGMDALAMGNYILEK
jgi:carbamoyltransferase